MRSKVSILVGSGFSIPEGIKGVSELNERLSRIDESEILIDSFQRASFIDGQENYNRNNKRDKRIFIQEFLNYYNSKVLKSSDQFHYEKFYDFYSSYQIDKKNTKIIDSFYKQFVKKNYNGKKDIRNCLIRVTDFNRSYCQLLASQLHNVKYSEPITLKNYPPYEQFVQFISELLKYSDVKFHTLNHDLFFDWLGKNHSLLLDYFSDGYQLAGSPFIGSLECEQNKGRNISYYIKLEQFVDKFDSSLALYKLHGSIDSKIVTCTNPVEKRAHLKNISLVSSILKEIKDDKTNEYKFVNLVDNVEPDFLSGITTKIKYYSNDVYYKNLFTHFENNLLESKLLVIIGYGFKDDGINEYLKKYYLSRNERMIVIDPKKPEIEWFERYDIKYVPKGVTQLSYKEYLELIPSGLKQ